MMEIAHENIRMSEPLNRARQVHSYQHRSLHYYPTQPTEHCSREPARSSSTAPLSRDTNEEQPVSGRLTRPWCHAMQDVERLKQELKRYSVEKEELRSIKARLLVVEEKYRSLKWESEVRRRRRFRTRTRRGWLLISFFACPVSLSPPLWLMAGSPRHIVPPPSVDAPRGPH